MGKVVINVDWCGKNYAASPDNDDIACVATGKTLVELKINMEDALRLHLDWMIADNDQLPDEFLGELCFDYHLTTRAQLHYSENFITRKALSEVTGINLQQLSHYANGWRHPRPGMQQRIKSGLNEIVQKLSIIL